MQKSDQNKYNINISDQKSMPSFFIRKLKKTLNSTIPQKQPAFVSLVPS